jgi:hypothetical protein
LSTDSPILKKWEPFSPQNKPAEIKSPCDSEVKRDSKNLKTVQKIKKNHFSYSSCYSNLTTNSTKYFAIFRNLGMNLEVLKSIRENIYPFVFPLCVFLKENEIGNVVLPPRGDRFKRNGFHFATELLFEVQKIIKINTFSPFIKNINTISLDEKVILPESFVMFDGIVTYGTTIKKMDSFLRGHDIIILITNH